MIEQSVMLTSLMHDAYSSLIRRLKNQGDDFEKRAVLVFMSWILLY